MQKIHNRLKKRFAWYDIWHQGSRSALMHWLILIFIAELFAFILVGLSSRRIIPLFSRADYYTNRIIQIADTSPTIYSTYAPAVIRNPNGPGYSMYFGRNEVINGQAGDRIYYSTSLTGTSNWSEPKMILSFGGPGEEALIHDPTLVQVDGTWHMYYTGVSDPGGAGGNRIFHATSPDGVHFTKQGPVRILGLPAPTANSTHFGYGNPSILYDNNNFSLYFYYDYNLAEGTISLANSSNGQDFSYVAPVISGPTALANPEISKIGNTYTLMADEVLTVQGYKKIVYATSDNKARFSNFTILLQPGPLSSWDSCHIGSPFFIPDGGRLYYAGSSDCTNDFIFNDAQIGLAYIHGQQAQTDTTPPVISQLTATNTSLGTEVISWRTSEPADSQVEYGHTSAYGFSSQLATTLVTEHAAQLKNLARGVYHYHVKSKDAAGNIAVSKDDTFIVGLVQK